MPLTFYLIYIFTFSLGRGSSDLESFKSCEFSLLVKIASEKKLMLKNGTVNHLIFSGFSN